MSIHITQARKVGIENIDDRLPWQYRCGGKPKERKDEAGGHTTSGK